MSNSLKFVTLVLALLMGVSPVFASASPLCRESTGAGMAAGSAMHCPHCLKMAMAKAAQASIAAKASGEVPPCCRVSSAKPVRTTEYQISTISAELALQTADPFLGAVLPAARLQSRQQLPIPDSANSAAHLCTFLI